MNTYTVLDGRANYDQDAASVMECFEAENDEKAKAEAEDTWEGHDYVLFRNVDHGDHCTLERVY